MPAAIDAVFGSPSARKSLVIAGACGNVGFGKLGQFARLLSKHGVPVVAVDVAPSVVDVPGRLRAELGKRFAPDAVDAICAGLTVVEGGIGDVAGEIGFVFEAVPERLDIKRPLYETLRRNHPDALLFSATSGFTTGQLFDGLDGADRCGVLHPFFPHLTNKIFELPTDGLTGPAALEAVGALFGALGLTTVDVRDVASFAADRIFCMLMLEAVRLHEETGADPAAIDAVARSVIGASPFLVHNMIRGANYLTVHCIDLLAGEQASTLYDVPEVFRRMAGDPDLQWPYDRKASPVEGETRETVRRRLLGNVLAVSSHIFEHGICATGDFNYLAEEALRWRMGPPGLLRELGLDEATALTEEYLEARAVTEAAVVAPLTGLAAGAAGDLYVTTEDVDGVRIVFLGRSSLNHVFVEEIGRAVGRAMEDDAIEAVVLAPDGRFNTEFGRGADVVCFLPALGDEAVAAELAGAWKEQLEPVASGSKPVVAALVRRSLGGSNELAFLCNYRVAAAGTTIGQPEPSVGVIPGLGGTHDLLRSVAPEARAAVVDLLLTGDPIDADRALDLGLVQEVVPAGELREASLRAARGLADGSVDYPAFENGPFDVEVPETLPEASGDGLVLDPEYLALLAETIAGAAERTFEEAQAFETAQSGKGFLLPAAAIGVKALLSGKRPDFSRRA